MPNRHRQDADVRLLHSGNALIIALSNGEAVRIVNHLAENCDYRIETITFADAVALGYQGAEIGYISDMP